MTLEYVTRASELRSRNRVMLGVRLALLIKLGPSEEQSPACCVCLNRLVSWACFDTDLANLGTWERLGTSRESQRCHKRGWAWKSNGFAFVFMCVSMCFHCSLLSSESSFVLRDSVLQRVFNSACFSLALEPIYKLHFGVWLTVLFAYKQEACKNKECSSVMSKICKLFIKLQASS